MRRTVLVAISACSLGALAACGPAVTTNASSSSDSSASVPTVATEAPTSSAAPAPVVPPQSGSSTQAVDFVMPNLVGVDLQSAQDQVQTHGILYSRSHDLRGSRHQVLDSNWIVCDQNIPAGQHVNGDIEGQIDFGVVKRGESCP